MRLTNKEEDNKSGKEASNSKENYYNRLHQSKNEEEWFYKNFKDSSNKWRHRDKIIKEKYKIEKCKENRSFKFSKN